MSTPEALISILADNAQTCPSCTTHFLTIYRVPTMAHGNLIPYPAIQSAAHCPACGYRFSGYKALNEKPKQIKGKRPVGRPRKLIDANKTYNTEELVKIFGAVSRAKIAEARDDGRLPFTDNGYKGHKYKGSDVIPLIDDFKPLKPYRKTKK